MFRVHVCNLKIGLSKVHALPCSRANVVAAINVVMSPSFFSLWGLYSSPRRRLARVLKFCMDSKISGIPLPQHYAKFGQINGGNFETPIQIHFVVIVRFGSKSKHAMFSPLYGKKTRSFLFFYRSVNIDL